MDNQEVKDRVEAFNVDGAIAELTGIIGETAEMIHKVKGIKFNYLTQVCEMYTRMDFPSIMMDACSKEVKQTVPDARTIRKLEY